MDYGGQQFHGLGIRIRSLGDADAIERGLGTLDQHDELTHSPLTDPEVELLALEQAHRAEHPFGRSQIPLSLGMPSLLLKRRPHDPDGGHAGRREDCQGDEHLQECRPSAVTGH